MWQMQGPLLEQFETSQSTLHFKFSMTIFEKIVVKTVEFYQLGIHYTQIMEFCIQNCKFYTVIKVSVQN